MLVWHQTVAHGTAPNDSTNCRMAQYMKAFSRSAAFGQIPLPRAVHPVGSTKAVKKGGKNKIKACETEASTLDSTTTEMADLKLTSQVPLPDYRHNPRLVRRATALARCLEESGADKAVTPLGRLLFGLDVLPAAVTAASAESEVVAAICK